MLFSLFRSRHGSHQMAYQLVNVLRMSCSGEGCAQKSTADIRLAMTRKRITPNLPKPLQPKVTPKYSVVSVVVNLSRHFTPHDATPCLRCSFLYLLVYLCAAPYEILPGLCRRITLHRWNIPMLLFFSSPLP